jgi:hypothetical protein
VENVVEVGGLVGELVARHSADLRPIFECSCKSTRQDPQCECYDLVIWCLCRVLY